MSCHSGPAPELTVAQVLKVFLPEYLDVAVDGIPWRLEVDVFSPEG